MYNTAPVAIPLLKPGDKVTFAAVEVGEVTKVGAVDMYGIRYAQGLIGDKMFYIEGYRDQVKVDKIIG
jgi:hypothetical protein